MTTPLIETIARAMEAESDFLRDSVATETLERCIAAAITALTEAGYAIVPVTPTEEMLANEPCPAEAEGIYRAMIEAGRAK